MTLLIITSILGGVLAIIFRRNRVVRYVAAAAAVLFALVAIFLEWRASGQGGALPVTTAMACFLVLVMVALLLPRAGADSSPAVEYVLPPVPDAESHPGTIPTSLPALYDSGALEAVRDGLRASFERSGRSVAAADALFVRLTANLRVLEHLYTLVGRMSVGDAAARAEFQGSLQYLVQRFPNYGGSMRLLRDRVTGAPTTMHARGPCAVMTLPGMASIYTGVFTVGALAGVDVPRALDVVVGLSLGHGNLEALSGSLIHEGPGGLDRAIESAELAGSPYLIPTGHRRGRGDIDPLPDGAAGWEFGGPLPVVGLIPEVVFTPALDPCELVREFCESMLIDSLAPEGFGSLTDTAPAPPGCRVDNINRVEVTPALRIVAPGGAHTARSGRCAGDVLEIYGSGFGDTPGRQVVVLNVGGECARVRVTPLPSIVVGGVEIPQPSWAVPYWSDTMIRLYLPEGITPGPVGIFDPVSIDLYNNWSSGVSARVREVETASKCLGTPLSGGSTPALTHVRVPLPADYTPCPARTERNVLERVGAPVIVSFTASLGRAWGETVVADPEDDLTLHWNVVNATNITISRLLFGPSFDGADQVRNPPGTSWSFGRLGHTSFARGIYILIASNENGCDSVMARVNVIMSRRPRLAINRVEVTQGIQKEDNSVVLVEGKPTVVRVFARHGLEGFAGRNFVPGVRGRLRVLDSVGAAISGWLDPINVPDPDPGSAQPPPFPSITLKATPSRAQINDTLNFRIPDDLCVGTVGFEIEVFIENYDAVAGSSGFTERVSARFDGFTCHKRRRLQIRFIPVKLTEDPNGVYVLQSGLSNPPTDEECRSFIAKGLKFIPAQADIWRLDGWSAELSAQTIVITTPQGSTRLQGPPSGSDSLEYDVRANLLLEQARLQHDQHDGQIWAFLVPIFSTSARIWGRGHIGLGQYITPMSDIRIGAHELAHCLNQRHLSVDCRPLGGGVANGGDTPGQWGEDGGRVVDVAFDIENNRTVSNAFDLMTYCPVQWTSPKRWKQMFDFIGE